MVCAMGTLRKQFQKDNYVCFLYGYVYICCSIGTLGVFFHNEWRLCEVGGLGRPGNTYWESKTVV